MKRMPAILPAALVRFGCVDFHVGLLHGRSVVLRTMSEKADGNVHESVDNLSDLAADNSSRIVLRRLEGMQP